MPTDLRPETVHGAIAAFQAALAPADARVFAVAMDELLAFGRSFNIGVPDPKGAVAAYRQALSDLPGDLILQAVRAAVASWAWGNRLPMPADLRALITDELWRRKRALTKAEAAGRRVRSQPSKRQESAERRPEDLAVVEAAMAKLRANPPTPRRMDVDRADGREPSKEPMAAVRARVEAEMASRTRIEVTR